MTVFVELSSGLRIPASDSVTEIMLETSSVSLSSTGYLDRASGPWFDLPALYSMVKFHIKVFCFILNNLGFVISSNVLSPKSLTRGL